MRFIKKEVLNNVYTVISERSVYQRPVSLRR